MGTAGCREIGRSAQDVKRMDFSIVTPSLNQRPWLKLAVASVADQNIQLEHIIQDAGSTDGTQEWLQSAGLPIRAFVERDSGMYDAVNRGFRRASGEFLAYINCDEQYLPGALMAVRDFFRQHPDVDVVLADAIWTDAQGNYLCHRCALTPVDPLMWISFPLLTCALFMRRSAVERAGIHFDTQWRDVGDFFFMLEMVKRKLRIAVLPQFTSVFTWTGDNMSQKPNAMRETQLKMQMSPTWVRWLRYFIIAHNRLRLAARGAFFKKPFAYSIYTPASPNHREIRHAERPTGLWKRGRKLISSPP